MFKNPSPEVQQEKIKTETLELFYQLYYSANNLQIGEELLKKIYNDVSAKDDAKHQELVKQVGIEAVEVMQCVKDIINAKYAIQRTHYHARYLPDVFKNTLKKAHQLLEVKIQREKTGRRAISTVSYSLDKPAFLEAKPDLLFVELQTFINHGKKNKNKTAFFKFLTAAFGDDYFNETPVEKFLIASLTVQDPIVHKWTLTASTVEDDVYLLARIANNEITSYWDKDLQTLNSSEFYAKTKADLKLEESVGSLMNKMATYLIEKLSAEQLVKLTNQLIDLEYAKSKIPLSETSLITYLIRNQLNKKLDRSPQMSDVVVGYAKKCLQHEVALNIHQQSVEMIAEAFGKKFIAVMYLPDAMPLPADPAQTSSVQGRASSAENNVKTLVAKISEPSEFFTQTLQAFKSLKLCNDQVLQALEANNNARFKFIYYGGKSPAIELDTFLDLVPIVQCLSKLIAHQDKIREEQAISAEMFQLLKVVFRFYVDVHKISNLQDRREVETTQPGVEGTFENAKLRVLSPEIKRLFGEGEGKRVGFADEPQAANTVQQAETPQTLFKKVQDFIQNPANAQNSFVNFLGLVFDTSYQQQTQSTCPVVPPQAFFQPASGALVVPATSNVPPAESPAKEPYVPSVRTPFNRK